MKKKYLSFAILFLGVLLITNNVLAYECSEQLKYVSCGTGANAVKGIPVIIPQSISFIVTLLKIAIPVVLIISGTIDMFKAIYSGNSETINKNKTKLVKKFVGALMAFLIITMTTNVVKLIAESNEKSTFASCMSCYLNNKCQSDCSDSYGCEKYQTEGDCKSGKSSQGDACVWKNGACGLKQSCSMYGKNTCPKKDDYGNNCAVRNNGLCTQID